MGKNTVRGNAILWTLLVIALVIVAFFLGSVYGSGTAPSQPSTSTSTATTTAEVGSGSDYYASPAEWQTYTDTSAGYSIAYPSDFSVDEPNSPAPSTDWRENNSDQAPGVKTFTLTIPSAFEPQTNFVDATLTVGYSQNDTAIADCLVAQNGEATSTTSDAINNATFDVFTLSSPGAGQAYDTTSYRTTHAGACYAVEYTIHSAELGNFPSSYGFTQFDESEVQNLLNQIVGTFTFL